MARRVLNLWKTAEFVDSGCSEVVNEEASARLWFSGDFENRFGSGDGRKIVAWLKIGCDFEKLLRRRRDGKRSWRGSSLVSASKIFGSGL